MLKQLLNLLVLSVLLIFSGCSLCEKEVIKEVPVPYKVPVKSKCVLPNDLCEFSGTGAEPVAKAFECLVNIKREFEACNNKEGN
jgi:hypothetical protein